jgi:hypothetical protein
MGNISTICPTHKRFKNLVGQIVGKLTIISFSHKVGNDIFWNCKCICGVECKISSKSFNSGTKSCGCMKFELSYKGVGDLSSTYFSMIKKSAIKRNLSFCVTKEFLWDLFLSQNKKCKLSNILLVMTKSYANNTIQTASLDRIDSSVGYVEGNVQWVHKDINFMKQNKSDEEFIKFCILVADNSRSRLVSG